MSALAASLPTVDCLHVIGDGDDVDLLREIETVFDVELDDKSLNWTTVGDIERTLQELRPASEKMGICPSTMAFNRVRLAIQAERGHRALRPTTLLSELGLPPPKRWAARFHTITGLALPRGRMSAFGCAGMLTVLVGVIGCGVASSTDVPLWLACLLIAVGVLVVEVDPGAHSGSTVGDLATAVSRLNYARLITEGADSRPSSMWSMLRAAIAEVFDVQAARITRDTRLFDH